MSSPNPLPMAEFDNVHEDDTAARGYVYALLGSLLARPPGAELLSNLSALAIPEPSVSLADGWLALRNSAAEADIDTLEQEYNDLFIGLARGELVPYGSYYLTGFLMEKPLGVLRRDLAALGIERADDVREPEDHAGALCETMNLLIGGDNPFETQRRFFLAHLAPWMGKFFQDLASAKTARFYRGVGAFGGRFIDFENDYFAMTV